MVRKIKKKKRQLIDPPDEVIQETDFESGNDSSPIHNEDSGFKSPQRDFPVKSTFEVTGNLGGSVKVSNTDTTTNMSDPASTTIPEKKKLIPAKVSMAEFIPEEDRTSDITMNIFHMDINVKKGEGKLQSSR